MNFVVQRARLRGPGVFPGWDGPEPGWLVPAAGLHSVPGRSGLLWLGSLVTKAKLYSPINQAFR